MADQDEGGDDSAEEGDDSTATSSADTKDEAEAKDEADTKDESDTAGKAGTEEGSDDPDDSDEGSEGSEGSDKAAESEGGFDLEAQRERLDSVDEQIEEGQRGLADLAGDSEPEPDGPPVAEDEGSANAPPG